MRGERVESSGDTWKGRVKEGLSMSSEITTAHTHSAGPRNRRRKFLRLVETLLL